MQNEFIVLLGDVVSSRGIENRKVFQQKLQKACNAVNAQFKKDLYAQLKVVKGIDEIGAVYTNTPTLYNSISLILDHIYPQKMRFACIRGRIDVGLLQPDVSKMDGPAFHKAAEAIAELRKKPELLLHLELGNKVLDAAISGQINLLLLLRDNWSEKQLHLICELKKRDSQLAVARKFKISQQAVSKSLKSSKWPAMQKIENDLPFLFNEYSKK